MTPDELASRKTSHRAIFSWKPPVSGAALGVLPISFTKNIASCDFFLETSGLSAHGAEIGRGARAPRAGVDGQRRQDAGAQTSPSELKAGGRKRTSGDGARAPRRGTCTKNITPCDCFLKTSDFCCFAQRPAEQSKAAAVHDFFLDHHASPAAPLITTSVWHRWMRCPRAVENLGFFAARLGGRRPWMASSAES